MSADTSDISSVLKTPRRCRNPASARKWAISSGSSPVRERPVQVERTAVPVAELHRSRRVDGHAVDQRPEDDPPVEEVPEVSAVHPERAPRQQRHRRLPVLDDLGEGPRRRSAPQRALPTFRRRDGAPSTRASVQIAGVGGDR